MLLLFPSFFVYGGVQVSGIRKRESHVLWQKFGTTEKVRPPQKMTDEEKEEDNEK